MSAKPTEKQLSRMVEILNEDHATMRDAAKACFEYASQVVAERSTHAVIVQLKSEPQPEGEGELELDTVVLGPYSTAGDADKVARSARMHKATGEARAMVVEWHDETADHWHKARGKAKGKVVETPADHLIAWLKENGYIPERND